ncbi:hypothetical protein FQZ97_1022130 [compost metagenome]
MSAEKPITIDSIMSQAQVFASGWSLIGGKFDAGDALDRALENKAELRRMVEQLAQRQQVGQQWISVSERLPEPGKKVIAFYSNLLCKDRRIMACYYGHRQREGYIEDCCNYDYDEATDTYWWPAGWYECIENWDDFSHLMVSEGEITHWMPLQAAP